MQRVYAFLKKHKLWIYFPLGLCLAFLFWKSWSDVPKIDEPVLSEHVELETIVSDETEHLKMLPKDVEDEMMWSVENHIVLHPDVSLLPNIMQVNHVSKLFKLLPPAAPSAPEEEVVDMRPKIAIVIDDMGASPKRTEGIITLKAPLTTSFVTFAPQLDRQVKQSVQSGHEIMIHVPMQPHADIFVSKDVLTIDMSEDQIIKNFAEMLAKFENVKGINNHMGSLFTEHAEKLAPIMKILAENHLFFLDSKTTTQSKVEEAAREYGVPYLSRNVFLDNENDLAYILQQLEKTEKIAKEKGYAIAIGHPKTKTVEALDLWLKTLDCKNLVLVPLSQLLSISVNP